MGLDDMAPCTVLGGGGSERRNLEDGGILRLGAAGDCWTRKRWEHKQEAQTSTTGVERNCVGCPLWCIFL